MEEVTQVNVHSCCRLCLCEKWETLKSVFDETIEDQNLPQKILQSVAVRINVTDRLSTMICEQCVAAVSSFHSYRHQCQQNQLKLRRILKQGFPEIIQQTMVNGLSDVSLQIKEEPADPEETMEDSLPLFVQIKTELTDNADISMTEEYNELPPQLTPHGTDGTIDVDSTGTPTSESERKCSVCEKVFSSPSNRKKHEKQMHKKVTPTYQGELYPRKSMSEIQPLAEDQTSEAGTQSEAPPCKEEPVNELEAESETDQQKIQFAAGLKLLQTNSTPISCENLSKIEVSYTEKCKAMVNMHKTLECACHNVTHPNLKGLLSHLRALRVWFPVFTCYNCMITFTDRSTFTKHNVRCPSSPLETITKLSNLRKRSEVKTRLYQNFRCTYCKFMYSFHEDFCKHIDEEHSNIQIPAICSCTRQFDNLEDYKDHVYVSCLVEYYCDICFITTDTLDEFQKHAAERHDNSEGFILLQDDNYKMRKPLTQTPSRPTIDESVILTGKRERRMSVKAPIVDTDGEDDESSQKSINPMFTNIPKSHNKTCPVCCKEYASYNNMMRHYKTHTSEEKMEAESAIDDSIYSCPDCGGMYNTLEWYRHLGEKHDAKGCKECGKMFQFDTELEQHRSVHLNLKVYRDSKTQALKTAMVSPSTEEPDGEILACNICEAVFISQEQLDEHSTTHENGVEIKKEPGVEEDKEEKKYFCEPCDKTYLTYSGLWDHNRRKHPERKGASNEVYPKQCKYCEKVLLNGAAYSRHKMIHEKPPPDSTNYVLFKPKKDDDNEEESYHTCKKCFKVFSSRYNLKNHLKCHGILPRRKFNCHVCQEGFTTKENLTQHIEETHDVAEFTDLVKIELNERPALIFACDKCPMTLPNRVALKKHKDEHTQQEQPHTLRNQVYCKYCKIAFSSVVSLTKHMHDEHEELPKPKGKIREREPTFSCPVCKKHFKTSSAVAAHMGWHKRGLNGEKAAKVLLQNKVKIENASTSKDPGYQCTTCYMELPNDTALQVHILEKHRNVHAVMLIPRCNTCSKDFNTQDEYETHKRLHDFLERQKQHERMMQDQNGEVKVKLEGKGKNFPCGYCSAGFSRADTLNAHMRQFHKEYVQNEFKCNQCDRVFDKQTSLSMHLKIHDKQRMSNPSSKPLFSCSICNMGFDLPKDLRAHTISAHPF